ETLAEQPDDETGPSLVVKPGHWTTTTQEMKSNYDDFIGSSTTTLVDDTDRPAKLAHTNFTFSSTRPVALAKGRAKQIEGELFFPEQSQGVRVRSQLRNSRSGGLESIGQPLLQKMPSYQYFVVVLSKEISQYGFLKVTDAVRMPWEEEFEVASQSHYRIHLADAAKRLPLPSNPLTWSSIAVIVWDEVDPTRMTTEQQLAMLDWLHWGGRLIINGPDSLDSLRGSFLEKHLPAESTSTRTLTAEDLSEWSDYWSQRERGKQSPPVQPTKPWSAIQLEPVADARDLPGGTNLFVEGQVGQGTIVLSAIQLAERDFINWPGYDSFLNAALLRRPRRVFSKGPYDGGVRVDWENYRDRRLDAHLATSVRIFARDSKTKANQWNVEESVENLFGAAGTVTKTNIDRVGGIGTWSNFNPVADAARDVLTEAAAVRVPGAGFVLSSVAVYLIVLVPFNWMVFRTINRVEWAWIAAPIVALLGTLVIVRQAQLDIGFVRSQTEVALLELQGEHPRGLLSRFTAFYSSLSTTYDLTFDNATAIATPFPASQKPKTIKESTWDVVFEKQNKTQLKGLAVSSASTKMVHSEEIVTLDGPLRISTNSRGYQQLENRLGHNLRDVVAIRRYFVGDDERYKSCWLGEVENGKAAVISLQETQLLDGQAPHASDRKQAAADSNQTQVNVEGLVKLGFDFPGKEDPQSSRREELRVVGLIDEVLPGTEVAPSASQIVGSTVVVAHMEYGALPACEPDVNSRTDVVPPKAKTITATP
ncbi:MAG: hypothetical protein AAGD11_00005, partial [Planctomycetota bacterium]